MQFTGMCTQPYRLSEIHGVAASVVLLNCFVNDSNENNMCLFNFYKKRTARQFYIRSQVTQDLGDTRLF